MKLNFSLLVFIFLVLVSQLEARHKLKGGKIHQRSKRTIGDIINWKLNLLQSIFGGIFGGGKKPSSAGYGPPKPSYGAPRPQRPVQKPRPSYSGPKRPSPQKPSYNAPSPQRPSYNGASSPQRPSYNGQQKPNYGGGRPTSRPRPPQPNRPNYNNGPSQSAPEPQQQFGPASVFKMLPAPNLATSAPQTGSRPSSSNLGSPSLDTYGSPQAGDVSVVATIQAQDTYGSPQAPATGGGEDSYGSPVGNPISTPGSYRSPKFVPLPLTTSNSYSAPAAPSSASSTSTQSFPSSSPAFISSVSNVNSAASAIGSYGSGAIDSYGPLIIQDNSADSYSAPDASVVVQASLPVTASDSYGGAITPVITQASAPAPASDSYGGAIAPVIVQAAAPAVLAQTTSDSYGGAIAPVIEVASAPLPASVPVVDEAPVIYELSNPEAPAPDSYGGAIAPVIVQPANTPVDPQTTVVLPQADQDSYGTPQSNVLQPQSDPDDYDPDDIPADQAAPLPGYENSDTLGSYAQADSFADDYDPSDVPPDQAENGLPAYGNSDSYGEAKSPILDPIISDNSADTGSPQTFDVYGSALAPVGTSAPVPDEIFTVDSKAPTSFDSYNPQSNEDSLSQSVTYDNSQADVIDLTEPQTDTPQFAPAIEQLPDLTVTDIDIRSEIVTPATIQEVVQDVIEDAQLPSYDEETPTASLLPPVISNVVDLKIDVPFGDDSVESATPTSAPVLFTYAPVEGPTFDDLEPQINIVVQNDEDGSSLSDPLNVIPDEYEESNYESDYDANDVPADQAEPLDSYGNEDVLDSYGNNDISSLNEIQLQEIDGPAPSPAFEDLRGIEFTTGASLLSLNDPIPTTYRSPIDFDFGTTAADGIEVGNVITSVEEAPDYFDNSLSNANEIEELSQPLYSDEYEEDSESDYSPENQKVIPIVVEESVTEESESLPSYDPVVLLVGTPQKKDSAASLAADLPLYEDSLESKTPRKRKAKGKKDKSLKQRYNNWFGPRNDWSRKIQRVQGRIRYKKQNQKKS